MRAKIGVTCGSAGVKMEANVARLVGPATLANGHLMHQQPKTWRTEFRQIVIDKGSLMSYRDGVRQ